MRCDYCGQPVQKAAAVTVNINDSQQTYCGCPAPTEELSCWQQMIRGWAWALTKPPVPQRRDTEQERRTPRPPLRRLAVFGSVAAKR